MAEELDFSKLNVLQVEDTFVCIKVMERFLARLGCQYLSTDNAHDAIDQIKRKKFDLAIIDLNIPEMPGTLIAQKFKELSPDTKLIATTAYVESFTREDCLNHGFSELLLKPANAQSLQETISRVMLSHGKEEFSHEELLEILNYFDNDVEFLEKSYEQLKKNLPNKINELELAINDKELLKIANKAHSIKNTLLYFGKGTALEAAQAIEKAARKNEEINFMYPLNDIKSGLDQLNDKVSYIKKLTHEKNMPDVIEMLELKKPLHF
jgi:CheY-like chemotaxis protein